MQIVGPKRVESSRFSSKLEQRDYCSYFMLLNRNLLFLVCFKDNNIDNDDSGDDDDDYNNNYKAVDDDDNVVVEAVT